MKFGNTEIEPGYTFGRSVLVSKADIIKFATLCEDFNPLHHDEAYAKASRFGGIIACGPHMVSIFTSYTATHLSAINPMVGLEFSYKFTAAVRAGDTVDMNWTVTSLTRSEKMRGVVLALDGEVRNHQRSYITSKGAVLLLDNV